MVLLTESDLQTALIYAVACLVGWLLGTILGNYFGNRLRTPLIAKWELEVSSGDPAV
jgi:hypothetical protein